MIGRRGDGDVIVAELEGELAGTQELGVMPALIVGIDGQAREPLGGQEQAVAVLAGPGETLIAATATDHIGLGQGQAEIDGEGEALAGRQRAGQLDPHHGVDDGEGQGLAVRPGHLQVVEAALPVLHALDPQHLVDADRVRGGVGAAALGQGVAAIVLLVQQQPEVAEGIGRMVGVGHRLAARQGAGGLVQADVDVIVDLLLPVAMAGRTRGVAVVGRGRPVLTLELAEFVLEGAARLVDRADALLCQGG